MMDTMKIREHMEGFGLAEYESVEHYINWNPEVFGVTEGNDWKGASDFTEDEIKLVSNIFDDVKGSKK